MGPAYNKIIVVQHGASDLHHNATIIAAFRCHNNHCVVTWPERDFPPNVYQLQVRTL